MTTLHSTIATFTTSLSETFADMSRAISENGKARAQKAHLAHNIKVLSAFDPHLLDDIGMKDFNRLPKAEHEKLLLGTVKRTF
jgi:hypothetical protein